jgi:cyclophilin family peptidyl-prolyl cis-trans isomerase
MWHHPMTGANHPMRGSGFTFKEFVLGDQRMRFGINQHFIGQLLSVCVFVFLNGSTGMAQEPSLEELQKRWAELQIQFAAKETEISLEQGDVKQLQLEYRALVEQANGLIGDLKEKAIADLQAHPTNSKTLRLIMGILLHEARKGQDQAVLETGDFLIASGIKPIYFEVASKAENLPISGREIFEELVIRHREAARDDLPRVKLHTNKGDIVVELYENQAPNTVANFISLVQSQHFNEIQFHRVIDGFMAQAGQNKSDGSPAAELNYTIACECYSPDARRHFTHCISMALAGKDTGAGQFFLTFTRTHQLDGEHTCFGRIIEGVEVLEKIERTANRSEEPVPNVVPDRIISAVVLRKRDHEYRPRRLGDPDPAAKAKLDQVPLLPADSPAASAEPGLPELPNDNLPAGEKKESSENDGGN